MNILYYASIVMVIFVLIGSRFRNRIIKGIGYTTLIAIPLYSMVMGGPWDFISSMLAILAAIVGFASSMYTNGYEDLKYGGGYLHILIDLFAVAVYTTFISINTIVFIVCWLIAEIIGFFTIVYEVERRTLTAGLRYIAISMIPSDMALMTLLASLSMKMTVTEALSASISDVGHLLIGLPPALYTIMILGFIAKAAVIPLHFWLPDAHSLAPAPASAILSGIMVKMGIYGVLRVLPSIDTAFTSTAFLFFGVITSIYGGFLALAQSDIKRILAYSTIEHTGLIITTLMLYRLYNLTIFLEAALVTICSHALYKAALFLNSGSIEVYSHTRDISRLGYLARKIPAEALSALISILSLIGVPPTIGFIAKLFLLTALIYHLIINPVLGTVLIALISIAIALAAIYSIKYATVYWGTWRGSSTESKEIDVSIELSKRLTIWEYIPAWLGIAGTPPIMIAILGTEVLKIELLAPLLLAMTLFLALTYYVYMRLRAASRDVQWLGGALP
ncbi:MAG: complex I subunit 5 family protein [Ignisphaera sp.]|nr:complex I subunit 5 family protein [Ignisphaera sp.]MCX8168287.1 complex I subunit 5 family protein [Ignisphaera sp.]MDW8085893.1 complex I subunit 5 family protein [Ignisphaera sp.]